MNFDKITEYSIVISMNLRNATPNDASIIHGFVNELAVFEKEPNGVQLSAEDYQRLMNEGGHFEAVIAEVDEIPAGMALWYPRFSTWVGPYIHLEDIYVNPDFRGEGVGSALLKHVAKTAVERGMKRMEWQVLDWNVKAQEVYKSMGAALLPEWVLCQMSEEALLNYVGRDK